MCETCRQFAAGFDRNLTFDQQIKDDLYALMARLRDLGLPFLISVQTIHDREKNEDCVRTMSWLPQQAADVLHMAQTALADDQTHPTGGPGALGRLLAGVLSGLPGRTASPDEVVAAFGGPDQLPLFGGPLDN